MFVRSLSLDLKSRHQPLIVSAVNALNHCRQLCCDSQTEAPMSGASSCSSRTLPPCDIQPLSGYHHRIKLPIICGGCTVHSGQSCGRRLSEVSPQPRSPRLAPSNVSRLALPIDFHSLDPDVPCCSQHSRSSHRSATQGAYGFKGYDRIVRGGHVVPKRRLLPLKCVTISQPYVAL